MRTHNPRKADPKKHGSGAARSNAVRDKVPGRRTSMSDPLGEQPSTFEPDQEEPGTGTVKDPDLHQPERQVTNTDVTDRPIG